MKLHLDILTGALIAVDEDGMPEVILGNGSLTFAGSVPKMAEPVAPLKAAAPKELVPIAKIPLAAEHQAALKADRAHPYLVYVGGLFAFRSSHVAGERYQRLLAKGCPPEAIQVLDLKTGLVMGVV